MDTQATAVEFPPLPEAIFPHNVGTPTYTADQMHAYGLASLAAKEVEVVMLREAADKLIKECCDALSEELAAWDLVPPLHHVQQAHDRCVAWLRRAALTQGAQS